MTASFTPADQLAIRSQIAHRGVAPIAEAVQYVNAYVDDVALAAGVAGDDVALAAGVAGDAGARGWIEDRLRLFIVMEAPRWYSAAGLDDPQAMSEFGVPLFAEFVSLARSPRTFGPGHLVAWFWLLHRALFAPAIDELFSAVRVTLGEAVANMAGEANAFESRIDWNSFFDE